ncbi:hypothetical protein SAMN03159341_11512 [Paenibacillus sp. 1_12]|uniref:hypothetical protein n=1 Tax=Paenibacillus sp. 1_12 TaxID=1566278 RepID=UPI0008F41F2E|nr:hypothetical protein [Paenibacillus sp. 1_12]SFM05275.1 hypothetical protein SAMN03159341_11512 [Paenibacillus sp. 1_12]
MLSEQLLYEEYPWSKPVIPDINPSEGFYDSIPWVFNQAQLELIDKMFSEMEGWFSDRGLPVDIAIYEVKLIFDDSLEVEFLSGAPEIRLIVKRYKQIFKKLE